MSSAVVTAEEEIASVAAQLVDLTRTVAAMESQFEAISERAENQQRRADNQQARAEAQRERIDLAARELGLQL